jgi:hypothetical protein
MPPLVSGTNTGSPRLCCGGDVGCSVDGTQTPTYGTSAHGPMGTALAAAGIEKAAALAIAASVGSINLRLVIADPSDDLVQFSVRRCVSKVDSLHWLNFAKRVGDHRPMALGRVALKAHQRHSMLSSQAKQLAKRRLAFRRS